MRVTAQDHYANSDDNIQFAGVAALDLDLHAQQIDRGHLYARKCYVEVDINFGKVQILAGKSACFGAASAKYLEFLL